MNENETKNKERVGPLIGSIIVIIVIIIGGVYLIKNINEKNIKNNLLEQNNEASPQPAAIIEIFEPIEKRIDIETE